MPTTSPEGIQTPANDDNYALTADLIKMAATIRSIVPVANLAQAEAVVAGMTSLSRTPSATQPLYVHQQDIGAVLYTVNGTTWTAVVPPVINLMHDPGTLTNVPDGISLSGNLATVTTNLPFSARVSVHARAHVLPVGSSAGTIRIYHGDTLVRAASWHTRTTTQQQNVSVDAQVLLPAGSQSLHLRIGTGGGAAQVNVGNPTLQVLGA